MRVKDVIDCLKVIRKYRFSGGELDVYWTKDKLYLFSGYIVGEFDLIDFIDFGKGVMLKLDLSLAEKVFLVGSVEDVKVREDEVVLGKEGYEVMLKSVSFMERDVVLNELKSIRDRGEGVEVDVSLMYVDGFDLSKLWTRSGVDLLDVVWVKNRKLICIGTDYVVVGSCLYSGEVDLSRWIYLFFWEVKDKVVKVLNFANVVRVVFDGGWVDISKRVLCESGIDDIVDGLIGRFSDRKGSKVLIDFVDMFSEGDVYIVCENNEVKGFEVFMKGVKVISRGVDGGVRYRIEEKFLDMVLEADEVCFVDGVLRLRKGDMDVYVLLREGR